MPLVNSYGLSETAAAVTIQEFPDASLDKAGKPIPGMHIKLFNPNEEGIGEVCMKGRNIFMGYFKDTKATKEVIDNEGYFHSGDLGFVDMHGYLEITGRIKEVIVTAGGENVSPMVIEDALKERCPILSHILVVGDERKYLSALLTLRVAFDKTGKPTEALTPDVQSFISSSLGTRVTTLHEAANDANLLSYIQQCVDEVNA